MQTLWNTGEYSRTIKNICPCQWRHHVYATVPVRNLQSWMFHASIIIYTCCKLFVILIWKYCLINKIPFRYSLGNRLYVNKAWWHTRRGNAVNEQYMLEQNKIMLRSCILECNKWTIVFLNWNTLTGHRVHRYWESGVDIYYIL